MKLHALCASAVALTLALISPAKAMETNKLFIGTMATTIIVGLYCTDFDVVEGAAVKFGDSLGANVDRYGPATLAAMMAIAGRNYDRDSLIPEVTQFVNQVLGELSDDKSKLGTSRFRGKYGPYMVTAGTMRRK
jgi:hypothetical protein